MTESETIQTIHDFFPEPLSVGEPDVAGALAVFPLFGPEAHAEYVSFPRGHECGVTLTEREGGASVNELAVDNATHTPVLLYEGEQVLGARQNRIFAASILVAAGSKVGVPVSCVEAGRWESSPALGVLLPAPDSAYPELRHLTSSERAGLLAEQRDSFADVRGDQGDVWAAIASKSDRHATASPTSAMRDIYENRRGELEEMQRAIRLHPGQSGAIAAIGGRLAVLDYVSRPDVFAELHGPLVQGYALDALEAEKSDPPTVEAARGFALLVADCAVVQRTPSVGLGGEIRIASNGVTGSALAVDGELIQLTAFPGTEPEADEAPARRFRISRPSRRR